MISTDGNYKLLHDCITYGEFWEQTGIHEFCQDLPDEPVYNALVWETEIADVYSAYFTGEWLLDISGATVSLELSADGGNTWFIIARTTTSTGGWVTIPCTPFDLTPWAGSDILMRVVVDNAAGNTGTVCVRNFEIWGKTDYIAPTATATLSGNMVGPGLYAGPVTVTITGSDNKGVKDIHYILDGTESVVSGNKATVKVTADGAHTVEFWAVDLIGNEGPHGFVSFNIDNTPPTVALTEPEPGLYLFGNKLLSMSKPFIIGAFTAQATADDSQGIAVVQFLLNGEVVGEDTEAPYDTYVAVKNMGGATLKAVAIDGVGNTAEDSLDITYYKFL
jgi:hypothetical protein